MQEYRPSHQIMLLLDRIDITEKVMSDLLEQLRSVSPRIRKGNLTNEDLYDLTNTVLHVESRITSNAEMLEDDLEHIYGEIDDFLYAEEQAEEKRKR